MLEWMVFPLLALLTSICKEAQFFFQIFFLYLCTKRVNGPEKVPKKCWTSAGTLGAKISQAQKGNTNIWKINWGLFLMITTLMITTFMITTPYRRDVTEITGDLKIRPQYFHDPPIVRVCNFGTPIPATCQFWPCLLYCLIPYQLCGSPLGTDN